METEYSIQFLINGVTFNFSIPDDELYRNLMENDAYSMNYIEQLLVAKILDIGTLKEVHRVEADGSLRELTKTVEERVTKGNSMPENNWGVPETKLLLDKYEQYLSLVGPMKKFKTKKVMWKAIADDIKNILNIIKTEEQCENRYKTILKRKKKAIENNTTSGSSRKEVPYEEELTKITAQDDSVEPEVMRGPTKTILKSRNVDEEEEKNRTKLEEKHKKKNLAEIYAQIQKQKEENRERRHKEKIELMKTLINSISGEGPTPPKVRRLCEESKD